MLMEYLEKQLGAGGYRKIPAQGTDCSIWIDRRDSSRGVCLFKDQQKLAKIPGLLDTYLEHIESVLKERMNISCRLLALIITDDISESKRLESSEHPRWFVSEDQGLVIFEDQPAEYGNLKTALTRPVTVLNSLKGMVSSVDVRRIPWITVALAAINVLVQLAAFLQERSGSAGLRNFMTLEIESYNINPEYYRLVTSIFFHFGWAHLFNNMLVLAFLGTAAELEIGRGRFLAAYLTTGICANVASVWWYTRQGELAVVTAGASGAIFGAAGLILAYIVFRRERMGNITGRRLIIMMALTLYNGMTQSGINNCAHAAGAAAGFILGAVMCLANIHRSSGSKE